MTLTLTKRVNKW